MKYLNEDQLERFQKSVKKKGNLRDILIFELMIYFGLRVSEALNITISHIDFQNHEIVIKGLKDGTKKTYSNVSEKLLRKLKKYISEYDIENHLFSISRVCVYKIFKRYLRSAKLPDHFSPHSLRHSCAFYMVQHGFSPYEIKNWLRHKSILSTQIYFETIQFENQGVQMSKMFDYSL